MKMMFVSARSVRYFHAYMILLYVKMPINEKIAETVPTFKTINEKYM